MATMRLCGATRSTESTLHRPCHPRNAAHGVEEGSYGFDLPIVGEVKAGRVKEYELCDYIGEVLRVPNTTFGSNIFGYKVVGHSMEHEGINEGDFLIVESFQPGGQWPKQGEMIVTHYLPEDSESRQDQSDTKDAEMVGPTVKIFAELRDKDGCPIYHLTWRNERERNKYDIRTHRIAPIGRVIGVYRPVGPGLLEKV